MVLFKFVGELCWEHLFPKAIVMVGGEEKDEDVEASRRDRPPKSSDKPTLLGVRDAAEPAPVRMTVHGVAPPGPGSDRPPPMSAQEAAEARAVLTSPAPPSPRAEEEEGDRSSHTRRSNEQGEESWSLPPLDRLPNEMETQPHPHPVPVPDLSEQDREDLKNSSEDITSPDIEMETSYNPRERFRTASGGGRNRESGGREQAAAYVAPLTLTPSVGNLGTASGIKVDNIVLQESRYHVTEPSLLMRRESTYPPHRLGHHGPTIGMLVMIVLLSAAAAAGAVYFSLKISEPPPAQRPRIVNLPDNDAERAQGALDRLAGNETPAPDTDGEDSPAAHVVAPRPQVRKSPKAAVKSAPKVESPAEPLADPKEAPVDSPKIKKEAPEPWLE